MLCVPKESVGMRIFRAPQHCFIDQSVASVSCEKPRLGVDPWSLGRTLFPQNSCVEATAPPPIVWSVTGDTFNASRTLNRQLV